MTNNIAERSQHNPDEIGASSVDYLMYSGYVTLGFMWLKMAELAYQNMSKNPAEEAFYLAKMKTAQFYFDRILPRAHGHAACLGRGAKSTMALDSDSFLF